MGFNFPNSTDHMLAAKNRQDLMSDALVEDDEKTSDFMLLLVMFLVVASVCSGLAMSLGMQFGPLVLIPSMVVGVLVAGLWGSRMAKKKAARNALLRKQRQEVADAEMARKLKAMKKERFEKGL